MADSRPAYDPLKENGRSTEDHLVEQPRHPSPPSRAGWLRRHPLRALEAAMVGLGVATGFAFPPVVAVTGTAPWSAVSAPVFMLVCIAAGVLVGGANAALVRLVLVRHLREVALHTRLVEQAAGWATATGDDEPLRASHLRLAEDADDALGTVPASLNALVETVAHGVRERARLEAELRHRATHDALTGLAGRAHLVEVLEGALAAGSATPPAVLFVDLDGFKAINDTHGHHAGDAVLRAVAERLRDALSADDVPSRFGGDEFVVLVADGDLDRARAAVHQVWARPVHVAGQALPVAGSCGGVRALPYETADALLQRADAAMYAAKQARKRAAQAPVAAR
ncbi:diguanylate cyclase (GGDEF) domain-containing protein [Quadrisphaera granulorum]|uniref:Diguanylate cyclase (GGDEF)-like protein n=1 Tax=Quadrisphaera granulorum TaxID=317664 RepID=A0A316AT44_9ACTN|nr:GGDEF domain-containing protein [Quadrisphaera granulorum]PWJ53287.1 diguanylate cyclase (GGDEF)-like protein [Quadrisphaera granulorum]SZE96961.1 diguanylate cyclase (GGDEF) domain-containing protein [Quadrisphaera granulorum]